MKEKIYTIPVNEVFGHECECPMCLLEKKLEDEYVEYFLGSSLMEPDHRIETNDKGFCRRHFELLYNRQENRLGLGLMIDTHLSEQNKKIKKLYESILKSAGKDREISLLKTVLSKDSGKDKKAQESINEIINMLNNLQNKCSICSKLIYTMDRYVDVICYLWFKEEDFKSRFNSGKGFCINHFKELLEGAVKYLSKKEVSVFAVNLIDLQVKNLERVNEDVNWFTKKFDYRNNDAPWGTSKDAIPRSIQKIAGYCDLK